MFYNNTKIEWSDEYEKYKIIQDRKFLSDFDMLMLEARDINKSNETKQ